MLYLNCAIVNFCFASTKDLTLTSVVFEYGKDYCLFAISGNLTLTSVVFEFICSVALGVNFFI